MSDAISSEDVKEDLRRRAVKGTVWTMGAQIGLYALRFGGHLIVARLLAPQAFALMLLVNTFVHGLMMFTDIGINAAIIQNPNGDDRHFLNTAWTIQVIRGALLWGVCVASTYPYATFMEREALLFLVPVAGLSVLLEGFNSTSLALLNRHMDLKRRMSFEVLVQLASTVTMIAWAVVSPTVWALVGGVLAGSAVTLVGSHTLFGAERDRFELNRRFIRVIITFGAWIFLTTLVGYMSDNVDRYTLGKIIQDDNLLGAYQVALTVGGIPFMLLVAVGYAIIFPMMGRSNEAGIELRRVYSKVKLPIFAAGGVMVCGLYATGPQLIQVLYDEAFWDAGWMLLPIAAGQWFKILSIPPANAVFALGKLYWVSIANTGKLIAFAVFVPILWKAGGMEAALWGFAAGDFVGFIVYSGALLRHDLGFPWKDITLTALVAAVALAGRALEAYLVDQRVSPYLIVLGVGAAVCAPWSMMAPTVIREIRRARRTS